MHTFTYIPTLFAYSIAVGAEHVGEQKADFLATFYDVGGIFGM